jgi:3-deoxy-manno-octulosonate cytidylyltransferase (CMP-KDO synthetase)
MDIFAFIPARYDSTRFPGKPLALIAGRPMIQHAYLCAKACQKISEVFVATDDQRIMDCVHSFGGKAILTAKGHASGTDRIAEAARKLGLKKDDLVVNVQGDQPLFEPSVISSLIRPLEEDRRIPMSTLKHPITDESDVENTNSVKVVTDKEGYALFFSRSPIPFFRDAKSSRTHHKHLGFYGYRMEFLSLFASLPVGHLESAEKLEQLRALENGYRIMVVESPFDSVEVDTRADIKKVEEMLAFLGAVKP